MLVLLVRNTIQCSKTQLSYQCVSVQCSRGVVWYEGSCDPYTSLYYTIYSQLMFIQSLNNSKLLHGPAAKLFRNA